MARATGLVPQGATSSPLSASFRIETGQTLSDGHHLASAFEFSIDTSSDGGSELTMSRPALRSARSPSGWRARALISGPATTSPSSVGLMLAEPFREFGLRHSASRL
ncbi:hypothetical protein ACWIEX_16865 [Bosea sp. NPDC055353]